MLAAGVLSGACAVQPSGSAPATTTPDGTVPREIRVDRNLLRYLPPELSGITLEFSPEASENAAASADLTGAESLAYAVAADEATGDLVVATVLAPFAPGLDDASFRRIRDSYDAAVCSPEGGLRGNAEGDLGGRLVHIGTCSAGSHTYATRLAASGVVVLAFSRGEDRLGEQLMSRLRDP